MTQAGDIASPSYIFEPKGDLKHLAKHFDQTPHYLFRTHAPASNGCSTEISISSAVIRYGKDHNDLLSLDKSRATSMLRDHLLWQNLHSDNLMSWTSSFMFAVQLGIYRYTTDRSRPELSEIRICILDTRNFPRGSFVPAVALLKAYGIQVLIS